MIELKEPCWLFLSLLRLHSSILNKTIQEGMINSL
jgi:hypothetical protein